MRANLNRRLDRIAGHIETATDLDAPECPECNPPIGDPPPHVEEGEVRRWAGRRPDGSKLVMTMDLREGPDLDPREHRMNPATGAREERCGVCGRWSVVHRLALDLGD